MINETSFIFVVYTFYADSSININISTLLLQLVILVVQIVTEKLI